eukprot:scaffold19179_cov149-Skeletonema_menzelii.AAC.1
MISYEYLEPYTSSMTRVQHQNKYSFKERRNKAERSMQQKVSRYLRMLDFSRLTMHAMTTQSNT